MSEQNDELWNQAREWFNNMNTNSRNQMILTMYKLCLTTRDTSHEKLVEALTTQWNDKLSKQNEYMKKLALENEILNKSQESSTNVIISRLNDLENIFTTSIMYTKPGEDNINQILGKIPGASLTNNGHGDYLFINNDFRIMISSKEHNSFKRSAIETKEEFGIHFAIMTFTNASDKAIDIEIEQTESGPLMLLYVTNLTQCPERLLYAIDTGIFLLRQNSKNDANKFIYEIDNFFKGINTLENSIKDRHRIIKELLAITNKDASHLVNIRNLLNKMITGSGNINIEERVIGFYCDLYYETGSRITKTMLEARCIENNIPARQVRDLGGIKTIREKALIILKNRNESFETITESSNETNE